MNLKKILLELIFWFPIFVGAYVIVSAIGLATSLNPILARAGTNYSAHSLAWVMIGTGIIIIRIKTPKDSFWKALQGLVASFLAIAITEGLFQVFIMITDRTFYPNTLNTNLMIVMFLSLTMVLKAYKTINWKRFAIFIGIFLLFFGIWIHSGFHITLGLSKTSGPTAFYSDYTTNITEILQWTIGMLGFVYAYRGK